MLVNAYTRVLQRSYLREGKNVLVNSIYPGTKHSKIPQVKHISCLPWHQAQQDTTGQTYVSHIYPGTKHSKIPQVKHVYKYKGGVIYYFFTETFKNKYFLRKIAMISLFLQRTVAKYVENFKLKTFRIFCMPPKWARLFLTWSKENTFFLSFS